LALKTKSELAKQTIWVILLLSCGLFSCFAWNWWNAQSPFEGAITRIHWDYAWDIEELRAVERECSSSSCEPEHSYNHYTRSWTTTTYLRSGKSTVPITTTNYAYRYTVNDWVVVGTQHATGEGNRERPYYPELILIRAYGSSDCPEHLELYSPTSPVLGCQRAGQQHPHHYIVIETLHLEHNFSDTCDIGFGRWTELRIESGVSGNYFSNRNRIDCSSVEFN
jgi:hypothetical protein